MRIFLILLLISSCSNYNFSFKKSENYNEFDKKILQMLIIGFKESEYDKISNKEDLKNIGGVILFNEDAISRGPKNIWTYRQLKALISDLQKNAKIPLFIAIDQEGGRVARIQQGHTMPDALTIKTAKTYGFKNNSQKTYTDNFNMARELKKLGINLNFTPVIDLEINKNSPAIAFKERAFSDNPKVVYQHSKEVIKAHNANNIICSLKHFPGHGSAFEDSHLGFTDVTNIWTEKELEPYELLLKNNKKMVNKNMIMISHVFNKKIDEKFPASLSENFIKKILKEQLNFNGIVITDDIQMNAIANNFGIEEAIIRSINAGNNIFLIGNNLNYDENFVKKFHKIVLNAVNSGRISKEKIENSYDKIIKIKKDFKIIK